MHDTPQVHADELMQIWVAYMLSWLVGLCGAGSSSVWDWHGLSWYRMRSVVNCGYLQRTVLEGDRAGASCTSGRRQRVSDGRRESGL